MEATCQINTRNWTMAQNVLMRHTKTKTSQGLARAVAFVVKDAKSKSPFVTISRIDSDMNKIATVRVLDRSLGVKRKVNRGSTTVKEMIVLARMSPNSKYSKMTDNRWPIKKPDFGSWHRDKGARFWAFVKQVAERMLSARHSSPHFLQISWNPVLDAISTYVDDKYKAAVGAWSGYSGKKRLILGAGDARMIGEGTHKCQLTVFNQLGMSGLYPNLDKSRNEAIHRILGPILQESINKNHEQQLRVAWDKYGIDLKQQLSSLGFK